MSIKRLEKSQRQRPLQQGDAPARLARLKNLDHAKARFKRRRLPYYGDKTRRYAQTQNAHTLAHMPRDNLFGNICFL